jgi:hypothetical protein
MDGMHQIARARYEVLRDTDSSGASVVEIRVGKVVVHRCVLCRDGMWR